MHVPVTELRTDIFVTNSVTISVTISVTVVCHNLLYTDRTIYIKWQ